MFLNFLFISSSNVIWLFILLQLRLLLAYGQRAQHGSGLGGSSEAAVAAAAVSDFNAELDSLSGASIPPYEEMNTWDRIEPRVDRWRRRNHNIYQHQQQRQQFRQRQRQQRQQLQRRRQPLQQQQQQQQPGARYPRRISSRHRQKSDPTQTPASSSSSLEYFSPRDALPPREIGSEQLPSTPHLNAIMDRAIGKVKNMLHELDRERGEQDWNVFDWICKTFTQFPSC